MNKLLNKALAVATALYGVAFQYGYIKGHEAAVTELEKAEKRWRNREKMRR